MSHRGNGTTKQIFHDLLSHVISPWMNSRGFLRKGHTFVIWQGKTCSSIRFQASKWSEPSRYEFTVNVGVFSAIIYKFENENATVPAFPDESHCHWRARLGELTPVGREGWWAFRDRFEADNVWKEIAELLDTYAFPMLRDRAN